MNHNLIATGTIEINATPEQMWKALTDPNIIKEYLYGTETITDWKVGNPITFQGEWEGHKYKDKGIIKEFVLNKQISYTYWSGFSGLEDKPENYSLVIYKIEPVGSGKIIFSWINKGFADEEKQKHSLSGMDAFMKQIKAVVERK